MKAIVVREFGGPEVMKLEDVPDPSPGPAQVLDPRAARSASIRWTPTSARAPTRASRSLPYTPGTDVARRRRSGRRRR